MCICLESETEQFVIDRNYICLNDRAPWADFCFKIINIKVTSGSDTQESECREAFCLHVGLVNVTMLSEFGPEHQNTPSITAEILAGHTWSLL